MINETDILVIGAGISGLTVAWRLQKAGRDVAVIEAASRAGGAIGTLREEGCLIETGPNSTLETSPLIGALIEDTGVAGERIYANPAAKNRFVLRGGRLIPVPLSPPAFLMTPLFSWGTKLGLAREPFIGPSAPDAQETVAQFVRRRLGAEFLDYAINPFVAGVYAGDPEKLSVRAAFPRLFELEQKYGSLIRGQIKGAKERRLNPEKSKQAAPMLSFRGGMQTLTDAIAGRLRRVECSVRATALARTGDGWTVTTEGPAGPATYRVRQVVLSVPAFVAARLVQPLAPAAAAALDAIVYPPVAAVVSAFDRAAIPHALDGFGFLVPEKEQRRILGTIFSSTLFENRAPEGIALLTTFVGGMRQPDLARQDEAGIAETVRAELAALLGATAAPRWIRVSRWPQAIPQYTLGHLDRMAALEAAERDLPGLHFCANYRGGISVGDCIKSAHSMAERLGGVPAKGSDNPGAMGSDPQGARANEGDEVKVLLVCMGNICRSPTAEAVLRSKLHAAGLGTRVAVDSAGTHAYHAGEPPDPRAQEAASRRGYEMKHLRARLVTESDFEDFDYLLAMDTHNLHALEKVCPPEHQHKLGLLMAYGERHGVGEVPDPYYGPAAGFERVLDLVEDAADGFVSRLDARAPRAGRS